MKFRLVFWALLASSVYGFAWTEKGLARCGGLFLLDQLDKWMSGWACNVDDELQVGNLYINGGYTHLEYKGGAYFFAEGFNYPWKMDLKNKLDIGYVGLKTQYKYASVEANVASLPYVDGKIGWNTGDSLFFAQVGMGHGQFVLARTNWSLDDTTAYIHELDGDWHFKFLSKMMSAGLKYGNHKLKLSMVSIQSDPDIGGHQGYVFTDTSSIGVYDMVYSYSGKDNAFFWTLAYANADVSVEGIHREKVSGAQDEKRFFYLPVEASLYMTMVEYRHWSSQGLYQRDRISLKAVAGYLELDIPYIPWKQGRFHPTLAPNQILDNSMIKLLSLGFYNQDYRIYGEGEVPLWLAGVRYDWNFRPAGWRINPYVDLDGFYVDAKMELGRRVETKKVAKILATTDTLNWNLTATGAVALMGLKVESPHKAVYADVHLMQLLPIYYKEKHFNLAGGGTQSEEPIEDPEQSQDVVMHPTLSGEGDRQSYRIFRNGFAVSAEIGFRI